MLALEQELVQVVFHLRVRKEGLALLSMKELDTLMKTLDTALNRIINKGYLVNKQLTLNGVMTSINT